MMCKHPSCTKQTPPDSPRSKYCSEHGERVWVYKRHRQLHQEKRRAFSRQNTKRIFRKKNGIPDIPIPIDAVCEICGKRRPNATCFEGLVPDHPHDKPGVLRGFLCPQCNRGIGLLGDSIENVQKALEYLVKSQEKLCTLSILSIK